MKPSSKLTFIQWLHNYNLPIELTPEDESDLYTVYLHMFDRFVHDKKEECIVRGIDLSDSTWDYDYYYSDGKVTTIENIDIKYVRFLRTKYIDKEGLSNDYDLRLWSTHFSNKDNLLNEYHIKDELIKFRFQWCLSVEYLVFELFDTVEAFSLTEITKMCNPCKGTIINLMDIDTNFCLN